VGGAPEILSGIQSCVGAFPSTSSLHCLHILLPKILKIPILIPNPDPET
jgi:hypothetical protein